MTFRRDLSKSASAADRVSATGGPHELTYAPLLTAYQIALGFAFATMLTMSLLATQGLTWLPMALAVLTFATAPRIPLAELARRDALALAALSLFLVWAIGRAASAPNPSYALFVVGVTASALVAAYFNLAVVRTARPSPRLMPETILFWWVALCICLMLVLGGVLNFKVFRGERALDLSRYNRAACAVALFAPLAIASLGQLTLNVWTRRALGAALLLLATGAVFQSVSESAKLVLPLALAVQLAVFAMPRLGRVIVWAAVALILAAPFVIQGLAHWALSTWMGSYQSGTFAARLSLWSDLARLVPSSFFLGNGVEFMRWRPAFTPDGLNTGINFPAGFMHPHSFMLQLWGELGLVGVLLFAAALIELTRSWPRYRPAHSALLHAMLVGVLTVSSVSDGLWQTWWTGFVALYFLFGFALIAGEEARASLKDGHGKPTRLRANLVHVLSVCYPFEPVGPRAWLLRIAPLFFALVLCQLSLFGAYLVRAGAGGARGFLADGALSGLMFAASCLGFLVQRPVELFNGADLERGVLKWLSFAAAVAATWVLLGFLTGVTDRIPRVTPFLYIWILVSLGLATSLAMKRARARLS